MRLSRVVVVLAVAMSVGAPAEAGSGPISLLVVNMTPDAKSCKASRASVRWFRQRLLATPRTLGDGVELAGLGETRLRRMVGVDKGGEPFMAWSRELFEPVWEGLRKSGKHADVQVLIDSRPEEESVDILVVSFFTGGPVALRLRALEVDRQAAQWLADAVFLHGDRGYQP